MIAWTHEDRDELIRENEERRAEIQRDIAERRERQLAGDEPIYDVVRRHGPSLVFKTKEDALVTQPQPTQPTEQRLTLEDVIEVIGEFVAEEQNKQDAALIKKMSQLRDEIDALRSELEVLRAGNVRTMVRRDVA